MLRKSIILLLIICQPLYAADYFSFTIDNDIFVGSDSGYTNGLYGSWYYVGETHLNEELPEPGPLLEPLSWSLTSTPALVTVNAYTIGQIMVTPENISRANPDPDDVPYSGLLLFTNSYLHITDKYADLIRTSLGLVGPASGAETTQKFMHDLLGSDEPQGWDSQLHNELVFSFTRGRIWRSLISNSEHFDLLLGTEITIGTLESAVSGTVMWRAGNSLADSYASPALRGSRTTNPVAVDRGWFVYFGLSANYTANQIFTTGNTFRDSPSADLEKRQAGASAGFAYSWETFSLTIAIEDLTLFERELEGVTRFGSITMAWAL